MVVEKSKESTYIKLAGILCLAGPVGQLTYLTLHPSARHQVPRWRNFSNLLIKITLAFQP